MSIKRTLLKTTALLALVAGSATHAQTVPSVNADASPEAQAATEPGGAGVEDIVVTAQRREENLQHVAAAITAISGEAIAARNILDVNDLTKVVPAFQAASGAGPYTNMSIRGVFSTVNNSFGDPAIAINVDQVNLARATSSRGLFYDLQRVEVLKGPQGILYGRNATGGAVNVISNPPELDDFSGYLNLTIGNYATFNTDGAVNVPLAPNAALRAAFQTARHDGYLSDGSDDADRQSGRLSLRVDPTGSLSIVLRGDYTQEGGVGGGGVALNRDGSFFAGERTSIVDSSPAAIRAFASTGCPTGSGRPCIPLSDNQYQRNRYWGVSGTAAWDVLGGSATVIAAHRQDRFRFLTAATGFIYQENNRAEQTSLEARFASDAAQPVSYIFGAYYISTSQSGLAEYDQQYAGGGNVYDIDVSGSSWAAFGQLSYRITDTIRVAGGLRYTHETKSINSLLDLTPFYRIGIDPIPTLGAPEIVTRDARSFNALNYRVGLEWDIAPRSLFYANVGTGFKSGGFFVNSASDPLGNSYEPETVTAYTIGIKNRFMDNRLQLNLEAFYLDYADQQVAALDINSSGYIVFPQYNVGGSTIKGVEADIQFLVTPNTRLSLLAQYIDARYRDFQFLSALSNFAPVGAQTACSVSQPRPINAAFTKYLVDCSGRQPLQSPEWSLTAGFQQTIPLANGAEIVANLHTFYETERYTQPNFLPFTVSEGGTRTGLSLTYRTDSWQVSGFVDNIEDRAVVQIAGTAAGSIRQPYAVLRPPRTFGVRLGARF